MRFGIWVVATVFGGLLLIGGAKAIEGRAQLPELTYSELIGYGIINAYSTNVLVQVGFRGRCLTKGDALDAIERNLAFVNVLERYAQSLNRSSTAKEEGMKKFIADMADVTAYLQQQTRALKECVNQPESKSAKGLYEKLCEKLEQKIELMLRK